MKREEAMELATHGFDKLSDALAQGKSDTLVTYLNVMARFHKYSFRNCLLISMQRSGATLVAGYRKWQALGRHVKKGEKGIAILAPMVSKQNADEQATGNESSEETLGKGSAKVLRGFRVVHVYDVEQTDGKPLPEFSAVDGDAGNWLEKLEHVVRAAGIELDYQDDLGGAEGVSTGGTISVLAGLSDAKSMLVLLHEYGHELLHKGTRRKETTKTIRETEAEAVAFVVAQAIGLDAEQHASDYIQLYNGDAETLQESMEFIQRTATQIIEALHDVDADAGESSPATPQEVHHVA
jgi:antirestriction protein ArdC